MQNRIKAEEYLKHTLKTDKPLADEKALKDIKWNKITINHVALCNTLAKLASIVPMPKLSREIIIYKLANPGVTDIQMAIMAGLRAMDVLRYEAEGKARITQYINRYSEQEIIDKANANGIALNEIRNLKLKSAPGGANKLN
jgi:hypothetical protein